MAYRVTERIFQSGRKEYAIERLMSDCDIWTTIQTIRDDKEEAILLAKKLHVDTTVKSKEVIFAIE